MSLPESVGIACGYVPYHSSSNIVGGVTGVTWRSHCHGRDQARGPKPAGVSTADLSHLGEQTTTDQMLYLFWRQEDAVGI